MSDYPHGFQEGVPWTRERCPTRPVGFVLGGCNEEAKDPINIDMKFVMVRALSTYVAQAVSAQDVVFDVQELNHR